MCLCANQIVLFSSKVPQVTTSNVFDLYNGLGMGTLVSKFALCLKNLINGPAWKFGTLHWFFGAVLFGQMDCIFVYFRSRAQRHHPVQPS